ncbi:MAG: hypothetical protein U9N34_09950, partial [Candidatus Cloacimonadota bacterium]|nr:hypothetical protein [Candidatus Cloacimonadota bacterium]
MIYVKKFLKIGFFVFFGIVLIITIIQLFVSTSYFSDSLSTYLSNKIDGKVKIENIKINIFTGNFSINEFTLQNVSDENLLSFGLF